MRTPSRLLDTTAIVTAMNRATVENIYDHLREAGVVPKGVRGKYGVQVTTEMAAKLLIAICGSEHVKDAAFAVNRYSVLGARYSRRHPPKKGEIVVPGPQWSIVAREFPKLGGLARDHSFLDALVALIDSYVEKTPAARVSVSIRGPYPGADVSVVLEQQSKPEWRVSVDYADDSDGDEISRVDSAKERQRRKFIALGGDLNVSSTITHVTFAALGELFRAS